PNAERRARRYPGDRRPRRGERRDSGRPDRRAIPTRRPRAPQELAQGSPGRSARPDPAAASEVTAILPGATIGLLGGGQLRRMTAWAARSMGYDVRVLDPAPDPPAGPLASQCITGRFDDAAAAARLAALADVVTLEIERIAPAALRAAAEFAPVRPGASV